MKPTLILLPGLLCDRSYYEPQLFELQEVAELRVANYSSASSIDEMAEMVLRDAPQRFAVAGHSMGGRVAQEIAMRVPKQVIGLGLFGTDYRGIRSEEQRSIEEAHRQECLDIVDREGFWSFAQQWVSRLIAGSRQSDTALISRIVQMATRYKRDGLDAHLRAGLSRADYGDLLPQINVPTLLIAGSEDKVRPPALHREMADLIPNARLAVIEGCGHMMSMEAPDEVTAQMRSWIASLL